MNKTSNLLWGLVLIILGVIFGLNALEITNINLFFDGWWTLIIIVPCFIDLFKKEDKTSNIIGIIIGLGLLLGCQKIISFELVWKLALPTVLVILGLSLIFKNTINTKVKKEIKKLNKSNSNEYCSTFGEQKIDFSKEEFNGCDLNAIFGSTKCDLSKTTIKDKSVINASAVFGNIVIFIPTDIEVKVTSTPIFGSVKDTRKKENDTKKTLYINVTCLFGGIEIK